MYVHLNAPWAWPHLQLYILRYALELSYLHAARASRHFSCHKHLSLPSKVVRNLFALSAVYWHHLLMARQQRLRTLCCPGSNVCRATARQYQLWLASGVSQGVTGTQAYNVMSILTWHVSLCYVMRAMRMWRFTDATPHVNLELDWKTFLGACLKFLWQPAVVKVSSIETRPSWFYCARTYTQSTRSY